MIAQIIIGVAIGYWLGRYNQDSAKNNTNKAITRSFPRESQNQQHVHTTPTGRVLPTPVDFNIVGLFMTVLSSYFLRGSMNAIEQLSPQESIEEEQTRQSAVNSNSASDRYEETASDTTSDNDTMIMTRTYSSSSCSSTCLLDECDDTTTTSASTPTKLREDRLRKKWNDREGGNINENQVDPCYSQRQSGVDVDLVPKHVAVIMDGNRRYGRKKYGSESRGHWDGSSKLIDFAKWCLAEHITTLTVYAFSTENWNRSETEIDSLMEIFATHCDELRVEATKRDIRVRVLSTDKSKIPPHVQAGLDRLEGETQSCSGRLTMNVCLSYGSRGEIVRACQSLALDAIHGRIDAKEITERDFERRLLTSTTSDDRDRDDPCACADTGSKGQISASDPDVLIRTSGEVRVSNFLLWQMAYTELFFLSKPWPEIEKEDLLNVIQEYASGRTRRYGH